VPAVELAEGVSAGGYSALGVGTLLTGAAFLENVLPLGTAGLLPSGGTIAFLNTGTGLAVAAALVLLFHEFLEELMDPRDPRRTRR
jgi:multicomponent Na+:H+ antiporter subunit B